MGKINWGRVVLGGLLAGVVLNAYDFIVWGWYLAADYAAAVEALGREEPGGGVMAMFVAWNFVFGIFLVWLYAAVRPRFGAGPKTAAMMGVAVWFLWYFMHTIVEAPLELFPSKIYLTAAILGLVQLVLALLAGGWLYQEGDSAPPSAA